MQRKRYYIHSIYNHFQISLLYHAFILNDTIKGSIVAYQRRALCNKNEPNIPGAEGDREARSYYKIREGVP